MSVSVALVIQHAMRMCRMVIRDGPGCTIFFFTLSHKRHDFRKKLSNIKSLFRFSLQLLSETFLILRRNDRDMIKKCTGRHVK
jgi:hypothetical protein